MSGTRVFLVWIAAAAVGAVVVPPLQAVLAVVRRPNKDAVRVVGLCMTIKAALMVEQVELVISDDFSPSPGA